MLCVVIECLCCCLVLLAVLCYCVFSSVVSLWAFFYVLVVLVSCLGLCLVIALSDVVRCVAYLVLMCVGLFGFFDSTPVRLFPWLLCFFVWFMLYLFSFSVFFDFTLSLCLFLCSFLFFFFFFCFPIRLHSFATLRPSALLFRSIF